MLESIRQLLKKRAKAIDVRPMKVWADRRGFDLRTVHDDEGCLVEPLVADPPWRIEWGAPHRAYIAVRELRIIGEAGTPRELSAMVLSRELKDEMEKQVFEQYVEDVQTRLDTETPAEMRWLVLYSQLGSGELGRLAERYAAVGSIKDWTAQWLAGALNDALAATIGAAPASEAVVLMLTRGRLTLRTSMPKVDEQRLTMWLSVFEHALREAKRMAREWEENADPVQSTHPAAWSRSSLADDAT